jgi:adenosylhomocysteine nucleosidase
MKLIAVLFLFFSPVLLSANAESSRSEKVGILAALPQELEVIKKEGQFKTITRGDASFYLGRLESVDVVATLSGGGKVNAAVAAQRLISEFGVHSLIFVGVGGGINPEFEIGDIVLASETFQHDYGFAGKTLVPHFPGTMPELGVGTGKEPLNFQADPSWPSLDSHPKGLMDSVTTLMKSAQAELRSVRIGEKMYQPKIRVGIFATGDQFIAEEAKKNELRDRGADVVEMEGAAVAQVATKNRVPFLIFRSISDKAGAQAKLDFPAFLSSVSQNHSILLKKLLQSNTFAAYLSAADGAPWAPASGRAESRSYCAGHACGPCRHQRCDP